eukprot:TRINITY_DN35016_c0_g1_i1.p1 TRINITY_DN35016_c0_g1~~TRINITY_DN35016_c0_g1_i1.p1  ORF type:complete len:292 (-),score=48.00 TRINITY_DN35016_c0_g1_i1:250-1125(-)
MAKVAVYNCRPAAIGRFTTHRRALFATWLAAGCALWQLLLGIPSAWNCFMTSFDSRSTLSRDDARAVYDNFARTGHKGGKDADSGYGGPAVRALLSMAHFAEAKTVLDYGCGQGKLAQLVLKEETHLRWRGVDQSPEMVERATKRLKWSGERAEFQLLADGEPSAVEVKEHSVDRFVSTYCLDLLSEEDMYKVLDLAERSLDPDSGLLLLAGITWGYRGKPWSLKTFAMTLAWELMYIFSRKTVGGCRPQTLEPYLRDRGWTVTSSVKTLPDGFPWMISEVVAAKPPRRGK